MHTADDMDSAQLGARLGWDDDFGHMRERLLSGGLKDVVSSTLSTLDQDETKMRSLLHCGTAQARAGCDVTIRYLYQVLRGLPKESVFAEIVLGFELASADARFVGLNLVMPEDWYVPMRDFDLHMRMLDYLHGVYPKVHVTLHAGELAVGLVAPDGLTFHIRATDDEGVSRSDLTHEYLRAEQGFSFSYLQLKTIAHNSVRYSFLSPDDGARVQSRLERELTRFESEF
jgi:adenosine deaminase